MFWGPQTQFIRGSRRDKYFNPEIDTKTKRQNVLRGPSPVHSRSTKRKYYIFKEGGRGVWRRPHAQIETIEILKQVQHHNGGGRGEGYGPLRQATY